MQAIKNFFGGKPQKQKKVRQQFINSDTPLDPEPGMDTIFNDDEALIEQVKVEEVKEGKIELELKAQRTMVKLKQKTILPAMCSIKSSGGTRTRVDLVCVLDVSGSMSGEKIKLVKDTMKFLLETLTPSDRLSIITFNNSGRRICGLKTVSKHNMESFLKDVEDIKAGGGTNIYSGMQLAIQTLRDRKFRNQVASIFLLSDGQDHKQPHTRCQALINSKPYSTLQAFSIHSFGFGNDHDENLMSDIARVMDGSFFFIEKFQVLDQAFCTALGGIISVVANQVEIKIQNIAKGLMDGVKIDKVFGEMWKPINQKQYSIKILQLMSGVQKDYILALEIPSIEKDVGDLQRNHDVLVVNYTAKGIKGEKMTGEQLLTLTLLNVEEEIPEISENAEVLENYLRVNAALVMDEGMKKAEQSRNKEAQQDFDKMINSIETNKKVRQQKMVGLVEDLRRARRNCEKEEFQVRGRKQMKKARNVHMQQRAADLDQDLYMNSVQTEMVTKLRSKKAK